MANIAFGAACAFIRKKQTKKTKQTYIKHMYMFVKRAENQSDWYF